MADEGRRLPQRTCVQCSATAGKRSLLRIAGKPGATWEPDPGCAMPGRGIYICRSAECVAGFIRRIRTSKGSARWKMGTEGTVLAERISAWWTEETKG